MTMGFAACAVTDPVCASSLTDGRDVSDSARFVLASVCQGERGDQKTKKIVPDAETIVSFWCYKK